MSWIRNIFGGKSSPQEVLVKLPLVESWIDKTLADHAAQARPVSELAKEYGFTRLQEFYSPETLARMKVVVVDKVPMPPLSKMGIHGFREFERMKAGGVTYKDTYFVKKSEVTRESLHFHELVHTIQWDHLGFRPFMAAYAGGLGEKGYENSPLETMAYDLEKHFEENGKPLNVEDFVRTQLDMMQAQQPVEGKKRAGGSRG